MNEIEKMYENCNFEKSMGVGSPLVLHPFTTEKQIKLIKLLAHKANNGLLINIHITNGGASMVFDDLGDESTSASSFINFEECIAKLVNNLWQDLTKEEKEQVKGILNE